MLSRSVKVTSVMVFAMAIYACNLPGSGVKDIDIVIENTATSAPAPDPLLSDTPEPEIEPLPEHSPPEVIRLENLHRLDLVASYETEDEKAISNLVQSVDGRYIAYAYWHDPEKAIRLLDLETGIILPSLLLHDLDVTSLAFSPDGQILAAGSLDGSISFWEVGSWELVDSFFVIDDGVASIAYSPDGQHLALGGYKNQLGVWNMASSEAQMLFQGSGPHVVDRVMFTNDGATIFADTDYADVTAWQIETGEKVHSVRGEACIGSFDLSSDEVLLAYGSSCSTADEPHDPLAAIAVRTLATGTIVTYGELMDTSTFMQYSADDSLLLTNAEGTVRFWDATDGSILDHLPKTARHIEFRLTGGGTRIILGESDGDILIYAVGP